METDQWYFKIRERARSSAHSRASTPRPTARPSLPANVSLSQILPPPPHPFRQLSSTPFRLIPDAGTEKLAGVLLISGKTRQVPSRRVTVRG